MKIGIISDIHSNLEALKAVFSDFEKEKVDKIICAGDIIGIGPYPSESLEFVRSNQDKFIVLIRGNHEGYLLKGVPLRNHNRKNERLLTDEERSMHFWTHKGLNDNQVEYIKNLKDCDEIEICGKRIVVEHYPMNSRKKFRSFFVKPTFKQISKLCEGKNADIYIFGHTHVDIFYDEDNKMFINPGSLGCPIKTGGANYGILEISENNTTYRQCVAEYNVDKVIEDMKNIKYPLHDVMIKVFYKR